jgi:XRE family transcriptional regulator, regulator of sulfur utilization
LRQLRVRAGISSQEQLAHRAGVHRTYVGRLERGESGVTVEMLAAVLAAMSVSLAEFFRPFSDVVRPKTPRKRG